MKQQLSDLKQKKLSKLIHICHIENFESDIIDVLFCKPKKNT